MGRKIEIDVDTLKDSNGHWNENDVKTIEKATGMEFWEITGEGRSNGKDEFTSEEIAQMSDREYGAKREKILKALSGGKIGNGKATDNNRSFSDNEIKGMSDAEYEKNRDRIMESMRKGRID